MPNLIDLKEDFTELSTFKTIAQAFAESSVVKLKNIRAGFEQNRSFYDEISHVYHLVKYNAGKRGLIKHDLKTQKENPTILVAVTSNLRFYGSLNIDIMTKFMAESKKEKQDLMVIGSTGSAYLGALGFSKPYQKLQFKKDAPDAPELQNFLDLVKGYTSIVLLYPKFFSLMSIMIGMVDITHSSEMSKHDVTDDLECLFEPELDKILDFFERQVHQTLFQRVLLETELARTAARLISMTSAEERTEDLLHEKRGEMIKLQRSIANVELLETFAGMKKWKK